MSYIRDNLMPNEKILFSARVHPAIVLPSGLSFIGSIAFVVYSLNTASQNNATSGIVGGFLLLISGMFFLFSIGLGL
jgi:hypothetical protein